ncbi:MAG: SIS domain-containing protein [Balneolales bacterium]
MKNHTTTLEAYLQEQQNKNNALAKFLSHPHDGATYTPKEIAQQPYLWRQTAATMADQTEGLKSFLQKAGLYNMKECPNLILTGAGTSDYVGLSLVDLLRTTFKTNCNNWPTTRITTNPDAFLTDNSNYVMLHFARSGNSPESIGVLEMALAHYPNVTHHIIITCNKDGQLANLADQHREKVYSIILDDATNDKGLAMTSSFSNMVVAGQALAHLDDINRFQDLIDRTAKAGEYLMHNYSNVIHDLASPSVTRAFYLGNNELFGAAAESALKVQELTAGQLIAKGEDTMAFRHGPVSAVDSNTLVCFLLSADKYTMRYELDVLYQFRNQFQKLGTQTAVICAQTPEKENNNGDGQDLTHYIAYDPEGEFNIPNYYQANVHVLFGQLFGLFSSYRRGINVDDPSSHNNALYSRTVQGVKLYDRIAE